MIIDGPLGVFDTETTGIDVETERIVTAYIGIVRGDQIETVARTLINPGIPIPAGATAVHGITDGVAAAGDDPAHAVLEIEGHLAALTARGIPIVIMNAPYDLTLLDREIARHHDGRPLSFTPARIIDPVVLDKAIDTYRKGKRTLTDLAAHYGVSIPDGGAHNAEIDALTAGMVARAILARPQFGEEANVDDVHTWSRTWRARQTEHIREYHRGLGNVIDPMEYRVTWPIHPRPHHARVYPFSAHPEDLKLTLGINCPECGDLGVTDIDDAEGLARIELRAAIHNSQGDLARQEATT